jgi:hypothetical protein
MATLPNDAVKTPQREVQRLLGRCLLRLQQYERLIKAIVAHSELSGPAHALEAIQAKRIDDLALKTLGALVGDLLKSYIVVAEADPFENATINSPENVDWVSTRIKLGVSGVDFAGIENGLKELVVLRNNLVHHFINQHDLWSLDGCRGAQDALIAAYNSIDQHLEKLQEWAEVLQKARRQAAELFQSDGVHEFIVNGIAPDGTVYWPSAGIVYALREAAGELAVDGWTSVEEASRRIAEREPEQLPAKYGCSSWQQVVHESRIFELRYFEVDGRRSARYRKKEGSTNSR